MKKYRKGNSYKLDLINMKDLDYSLNGSDNEKEYFKTYFISEWVNLPIIGRYIAEFLDIVDKFRGK